MKNTIVLCISFTFFLFCKRKEKETLLTGKPTAYVLKVPAYMGEYKIPTDNPLTIEGVKLGRELFYDPILSKDFTVSCASCHQQKFAFSDTAQFSKGVNNLKGKRHSMSLHNVLWQKDFFWDGRATSLENQVHFPLADKTEMNLPIEEAIARLNSSDKYKKLFKEAFGEQQISLSLLEKAIAQFERTLNSTNSRYDQYLQGKTMFTEQEIRGKELFFTHPIPENNVRGGNCGDCHTIFSTFTFDFRNTGLDSITTDYGRASVTNSSLDEAKFKTPSLRNIALSAPYMHDGRLKTLDDVLNHYNEHIKNHTNLDPLISVASNNKNGKTLGLTNQEKKDIIAFLHTLTDSSFITNPLLSKP